jgi:UDP-N-acetylmuramoylalanine--D-glutamate ligase
MTDIASPLPSQNTGTVITDWSNKKVAILGLGVEGLASLQFLQKKGASIWVLERKEREELDQKIVTQAEEVGVQFVLGKNYLDTLSQFDVIFRSPGVKRLRTELIEAEKQGVIITSQTKVFFDLCPAQIIGVTGTKGKGTTASLIYEMLKAAGKDVYLGGNIGVPPLTFLEKLQPTSWVVLELSSFQLQDLHKSPHVAVMLMVTSEHMDYHATQEEYVDAKRNILRFQTKDDFAVINRDYPASNESDMYTEGKIYLVSRERETDDACFCANGKVVVRKTGSDDVIIDNTEILLPGKHNLENVCAAVMAAKLAQVGDKHIVQVLKTFRGLEHRLELVREVNGVKYYDDSFSTTPETAIAAIEAFPNPKILILGGSPKGSDFTELGKVLRETESIKAIIGIGDEWYRIKEQLGTKPEQMLLIENVENMQSVVAAAAKIATKGDIVLLSPACASFGMFKNYKDRGEQFKKEVSKLV